MNRNLHSPTKLTEFARDFDIEPDTFFAKFVNKITNVYNSGYNSVNVVPTTSTVLNVGHTSASNSQTSTPTHSSSISSHDGSSASLSSDQFTDGNLNKPQSQLVDDSNDDRLGELHQRTGRTPTSVMQRISNIIAIRNNVKLFFSIYIFL